MWERHLQTIMLAIMLGVIGFIGSQYASQDTRITVAENNVTALGLRTSRLEDRQDANMAEIRAMVQRIEDKIDRKADKP